VRQTTTEGFRDYDPDQTEIKRQRMAIARSAMAEVIDGLQKLRNIGAPEFHLPQELHDFFSGVVAEGMATCKKETT